MALKLLYRNLLHTVDNHGLRGLFQKAVPPVPGPGYAPHLPHPFDLAHGVDTSGFVPGESLVSGSPSDLYNTAYWAISPSTLRQACAALPFRPGDFTFVDLGCGKGRALLVAAQQGFASVLGVELSPSLAQVARANAATLSGDAIRSGITIRTQDAASVLFPPGPLLVFLYRPFLDPLLRRVLRNLLHQQDGRPVYLLFANPPKPALIARFPALALCWTLDCDLSPEDRDADRHGIFFERYRLYQVA